MTASFKIGDRDVGAAYPPLVIAEIGINHGGDVRVALEMAEAAIAAGAEVVKHQTHVVADEMSVEANSAIPGNSSISIRDIMVQCALAEADERRLMEYVHERGATYISTPFSRLALERIIRFDVAAIKVGSGECNNLPFIELVAQARKPVILSTGMNNLSSIRRSVEILEHYNVPVALLHCTNIYPTDESDIRLLAMCELQEAFPNTVIGLSDHSTTIYPCVGAVALGASIIERHFTDSRDRNGPDIECSMTPAELKELINASWRVHAARRGGKGALDGERITQGFAFSSVVAIAEILPGEVLDSSNTWVMRPSGGDFAAAELQHVLGSVAMTRITAMTQIRSADIQMPNGRQLGAG